MSPADRARYFELMADADMHQARSFEAMADAYGIEGKAALASRYRNMAAARRSCEFEYRQLAAKANQIPA